MNLKSFSDIYDLHDSGVENVCYFPGNGKLIVDLILSNWRQCFYKAEEPELVSGKLIFTGVSVYVLQAKYDTFDQDEILRVEFFQPENPEKGGFLITLAAIYFPTKEQEIKTIKIEADAVIWEATKS